MNYKARSSQTPSIKGRFGARARRTLPAFCVEVHFWGYTRSIRLTIEALDQGQLRRHYTLASRNVAVISPACCLKHRMRTVAPGESFNGVSDDH